MGSSNGPGGSSHGEGAHNEVSRVSEKHEPTEKSSHRLQSAVDGEARKEHHAQVKEERNPEKRLGRRTAGRGTYGECVIADTKMCGKDKDTAVTLKNGLPESVKTNSQSWERDSKNPQIWHVEEGNRKFDLKADLRVQGNDLTAQVKYGNGREVSFKNGQPNEIKHPDGEVWKADAKNPGSWDVTKPNKDDPAHPHRTKINDVKVDASNGDIKWNVDQAGGKVQAREITADGKYHGGNLAAEHAQTKQGDHQAKHVEDHVPVKQGDHQPAAKQAADHVPVKQGDHQPAAKQVEGAKPGEHLELSKPADTQTHPSDQLLQKTKESFNDALKDGKMSSKETCDLMRNVNQGLDGMSKPEREAFLAKFDQFTKDYDKANPDKPHVGIFVDSADHGRLAQINVGDKTYINQIGEKDHRAHPAEVVNKSNNPIEQDIINHPEQYNCHRTAMALVGKGNEFFRDKTGNATVLEDNIIKAAGYERVQINSASDLKPGDIVGVPYQGLESPMSAMGWKHTGTVTMNDGHPVITQKIGSSGDKNDLEHLLVRQDPKDFAGTYTKNNEIGHNDGIYVYRKTESAEPSNHARAREQALVVAKSISAPSMEIPPVHRGALLNRLHSDSAPVHNEVHQNNTRGVLLDRLHSDSAPASSSKLEHPQSTNAADVNQPRQNSTDVTNMGHVMHNQLNSLLHTGFDFRNTRQNFSDSGNNHYSAGLRASLPNATRMYSNIRRS